MQALSSDVKYPQAWLLCIVVFQAGINMPVLATVSACLKLALARSGVRMEGRLPKLGLYTVSRCAHENSGKRAQSQEFRETPCTRGSPALFAQAS